MPVVNDSADQSPIFLQALWALAPTMPAWQAFYGPSAAITTRSPPCSSLSVRPRAWCTWARASSPCTRGIQTASFSHVRSAGSSNIFMCSLHPPNTHTHTQTHTHTHTLGMPLGMPLTGQQPPLGYLVYPFQPSAKYTGHLIKW